MRKLPRIISSSGAGVLAVALALPLSSVFGRPDLSVAFKCILVTLWATAAASPLAGACLLVGLVPLALGVSALGGLLSSGVVECLVLAFASGGALGVLVRGPSPAIDRLSQPALVFGAAVVASALVDLAAVRAVAPARPFFSDLVVHVTREYWAEDRGSWTVLHDALRWTSVLFMAVLVERAVRARPSFRPFVVAIWLGSAAAATTFTIVRIAEIAQRTPQPVVHSVLAILETQRVSVLHPDPNAAGSSFGMLLVAAITLCASSRAWWKWLLPVVLFLTGFVFAQSRAAIGAVALVGTARWIVPRIQQRAFLAAALVVAAVVGISGAWMVMSRAHVSPLVALELRLQMARVGLRMATAERSRVFGVGLSDYARTSRRFVTEDMNELAGFAGNGENAHNNFLQILVELGAPAFAAFLWLVLPPAWTAWRPRGDTPAEFRGLALGLCVFLISGLFGHPLLIPEAAAMLFVGLALASSFLEISTTQQARRRTIAWGGTAFFLLSVFWRIQRI